MVDPFHGDEQHPPGGDQDPDEPFRGLPGGQIAEIGKGDAMDPKEQTPGKQVDPDRENRARQGQGGKDPGEKMGDLRGVLPDQPDLLLRDIQLGI